MLTEQDKLRFLNGFNVLIDEVVSNSKSKENWPEDEEQAYLDFVEEINEFKEAFRYGINKKTTEELADVFLSGCVLASKMAINIPSAMLDKHAINTGRPNGHKRVFTRYICSKCGNKIKVCEGELIPRYCFDCGMLKTYKEAI